MNGQLKIVSSTVIFSFNVTSTVMVGVYQTKILQAGGLDAIHDLLVVYNNHGEDTVIAAVAALKNVSIHQGSEVGEVNCVCMCACIKCILCMHAS